MMAKFLITHRICQTTKKPRCQKGTGACEIVKSEINISVLALVALVSAANFKLGRRLGDDCL
jgi:hypothetical protein